MNNDQVKFTLDQQIMSRDIDQLGIALAKAQGEFNVAYKGSNNPFFKSKYADFESIVTASRAALSKNGLSVIQAPFIFTEDGNSYLITILLHSSGQWIKSIARHNPPKSDVQSLSSYNTYLKRMCYTSLVGVVTSDEDDDGEAAVAPSRSVQNRPVANEKDMVTKDQYDMLQHALTGHADIAALLLKHYNIDDIDQLPKDQFNYVNDKINERKVKKMTLQN